MDISIASLLDLVEMEDYDSISANKENFAKMLEAESKSIYDTRNKTGNKKFASDELVVIARLKNALNRLQQKYKFTRKSHRKASDKLVKDIKQMEAKIHANAPIPTPASVESKPTPVAKATPAKKPKATSTGKPKGAPLAKTVKKSTGKLKQVSKKVASSSPKPEPVVEEAVKVEPTVVQQPTPKVQKVHSERRSAEQVQQEKMMKLMIAMMHETNKANQLLEDKRHHAELEIIENKKILLRTEEARVKETIERAKTDRAESSNKVKKFATSAHKSMFKVKYDYLNSEQGQYANKDRNRTIRAQEKSRVQRAQMAREKAELALEATLQRNAEKEKQRAERRRRDAERADRSERMQRSKKISELNKAFQGVLTESSPLLGGAWGIGSHVASKMSGGLSWSPKAKQPTQEGGDGLMESAAAGAVGAAGLSLTGFLGKKFKGLFGGKNKPKPSSSSGAKIPKSLKLGGKLAGPVAGIIAGALEYQESGNIKKSLSVGGGASLGAVVGGYLGTAIGALGGPIGMYLGGIAGSAVGGYIGGKAGTNVYDIAKNTSDYFAGGKEKRYSGKNGLYTNAYLLSSNKRASNLGISSSVKPKSAMETVKSIMSSGKKVLSKNHIDMISKVANQHGIPPEHLLAMAQYESRGDANAVSKTGAMGLFQFTKGTGKAYGLMNDSDRLDPLKNTVAAAKLYKDNKKYLEAHNEQATLENIYMAHQEGAGGARILLKASRGEGSLTDTVRRNMSLNVGSNAGGMSDQEKATRFLQVNSEKLNSAKSMIMSQIQLDSTAKASKSSPAPVNIVGGSPSSNVTNNNTTVINKPDTDPTIRRMLNQMMYPSGFAY